MFILSMESDEFTLIDQRLRVHLGDIIEIKIIGFRVKKQVFDCQFGNVGILFPLGSGSDLFKFLVENLGTKVWLWYDYDKEVICFQESNYAV